MNCNCNALKDFNKPVRCSLEGCCTLPSEVWLTLLEEKHTETIIWPRSDHLQFKLMNYDDCHFYYVFKAHSTIS